jgi:hypothetical protein
MAAAAKPEPTPAVVPPHDDDDFDPQAGAPLPPKAPSEHPARGGEEPRGQGGNPRAGDAEDDAGPSVLRGQGATASQRLPSAERPKLGARVEPWIKRALKIAAAVEGRKEEALVEEALTSYFFQRHPELAANERKNAYTRTT